MTGAHCESEDKENASQNVQLANATKKCEQKDDSGWHMYARRQPGVARAEEPPSSRAGGEGAMLDEMLMKC